MVHYRDLPSVHELLHHPQIQPLTRGVLHASAVQVIRSLLTFAREDIRRQKQDGHQERGRLIQGIIRELERLRISPFRRVINATGVLIHTNLGRAPLSKEALDKMVEVGQGYSTIEYHLEKGHRGDRNDFVEQLLCLLTGAEGALVVNNNAAAVLLCLNTLADHKEVLISRGELVEIGSSFRIPDIMEKSGARLREVGTTNKTRLSDYQKAIRDDTALILKVHTSNYEIVGFAQSAPLKDLVRLAQGKKKALLFDAGSGLLLPRGLPPQGAFQEGTQEPLIQEAVKAGADLVTFSGDKLLGGPQAGLILGKKRWIRQLRKNPLYRVLRMDKILLAGLEQTLRHYLKDEAAQKIPFLKMLGRPSSQIEKKVRHLKRTLERRLGPLPHVEVKRDVAKVGGGSFPRLKVPTVVLSLAGPRQALIALEKRLRLPKDPKHLPLIGRIQKNRLILDFRTVLDSEWDQVQKRLIGAFTDNRAKESDLMDTSRF